MRAIFLIVLLMVASGTAPVFGSTSSGIKINLCLNAVKPKHRELLQNILELHLLMRPNLETGECHAVWPEDLPYVFWQEIEEIGSQKKARYQIKTALYHPDGRAIMSQVEFIDRLSRHIMIDRAESFSNLIIRSIDQNQQVWDPFAMSDQHEAARPEITTVLPKDREADHALEKDENGGHHPANAIELFIGMERDSEGDALDVHLGSSAKMATKPILFIGARYELQALKPVVISAIFRGAAMAIELMRPIGAARENIKTSKKLDALLRGQWMVVDKPNFDLGLGLVSTFAYFDSDIKEYVKDIYLGNYWQLRQGLGLESSIYFDLLETNILLSVDGFPFIQNFSLPSKKPFVNYGWRLGLAAESALYRSFSLRYSLFQSVDHFAFEASFQQKRIVSYQTLAYLGLVMRI